MCSSDLEELIASLHGSSQLSGHIPYTEYYRNQLDYMHHINTRYYTILYGNMLRLFNLEVWHMKKQKSYEKM